MKKIELVDVWRVMRGGGAPLHWGGPEGFSKEEWNECQLCSSVPGSS